MKQKKMKKSILILGPRLEKIGGQVTHMKQLLSSQLKNEYNLFHLEIGSDIVKENKLRLCIRILKSCMILLLTTRRHKPSVIHINSAMNFKALFRDCLYIVILCVLNKKILLQFHGGGSDNYLGRVSIFFRPLLHFILGLPSQIVVINKSKYSECRAFLPRQIIRLVPNAIDTSQYKGIKNFNIAEKFNLIYLGRLDEGKGIIEAIEAISQLKNQSFYKELCFNIFGDGKLKSQILAKINELGCNENIFVKGIVQGQSKIKSWMDAHLLLFPSYLHEGMPYTLLESLASGTPIISTDIGGMKDIIEDGIDGIIIPPRDSQAIANAIKVLAYDKQLIESMSANCRLKATRVYGISRMAYQFKSIYEEIASVQ